MAVKKTQKSSRAKTKAKTKTKVKAKVKTKTKAKVTKVKKTSVGTKKRTAKKASPKKRAVKKRAKVLKKLLRKKVVAPAKHQKAWSLRSVTGASGLMKGRSCVILLSSGIRSALCINGSSISMPIKTEMTLLHGLRVSCMIRYVQKR